MTDFAELPLPNLDQVIEDFIRALLDFEARAALNEGWQFEFKDSQNAAHRMRVPVPLSSTDYKISSDGYYLDTGFAGQFKLISHFGSYLNPYDDEQHVQDVAQLNQRRAKVNLGELEEPLKSALSTVCRDLYIGKAYQRFFKNKGVIYHSNGYIYYKDRKGNQRRALGMYRDHNRIENKIEVNADSEGRKKSEIEIAIFDDYSSSHLDLKSTIKHELLHWIFSRIMSYSMKYTEVIITGEPEPVKVLADHPFIYLLTRKSALCEGIHDGRFDYHLNDLGARQLETDFKLPFLRLLPIPTIETIRRDVLMAMNLNDPRKLKSALSNPKFLKTVLDDGLMIALLPEYRRAEIPYNQPLSEMVPPQNWDEIMFLNAQCAMILRRMFQEVADQHIREDGARSLSEIMASPGPEWRARMKSFLRTYVETIAADNFVGAVEAADRIPFL